MNEEPYTKREQDEWRKDVQEKLNQILAQTTKTNGRVSSLEGWRQYSLGGATVFSVIVIPMLGFLSYMLIQVGNHVAAIDSVITQIETQK